MPDMAGKEHLSVTPEESGLYKGLVRCENCRYEDKSRGVCLNFEELNEKEDYHLDTKIIPKGCCNAFMKSHPTIKRMREKGESLED